MLFFKLLGKRGAAITEYAVLLAFVAVIATSFTKSDGLEDSMRGFISRVEKTVGVDNNYPEDVGGSSGEGSTEEGAPVVATVVPLAVATLAVARKMVAPVVAIMATLAVEGKLEALLGAAVVTMALLIPIPKMPTRE